MKVYKDGVVANATKDQLEALKAAGWSTTPEEKKTETSSEKKTSARGVKKRSLTKKSDSNG